MGSQAVCVDARKRQRARAYGPAQNQATGGGLHNIAIYDDGTEPEDINVNAVQLATGTPNDVPSINDPTNRICRGLDPSLQPGDRAEVVEFLKPGTCLVIRGLRPHFVLGGMYGYVQVLP